MIESELLARIQDLERRLSRQEAHRHGSGDFIYVPTVTVTGATAVTADHFIILANATLTATLPTAVGINGKIYHIKNIGTGTLTIATTSSQTIDGSLTLTIATRYDAVMLVSDGANWSIL